MNDLLKFPVCTHKKQRVMAPVGLVRLWAAEPFRIFFLLGSLWAILGVALWPLFYLGKLPYFPNMAHAHLMIQSFAGAFVIGFLGTAGPRMLSGPKFLPTELFTLVALHSAAAVLHLCNMARWGDGLFVVTLLVFLAFMLKRVLSYRKGALPPQIMLSMGGLASAVIGTVLMNVPQWQTSMGLYQLARLLLFQGFLLLPILGIGSFLFPRLLGLSADEVEKAREKKLRLWRCFAAGVLVLASLAWEAWGHSYLGTALRVLTIGLFFGYEIPWNRPQAGAKRGTWTTGLYLAVLGIIAGLVLAASLGELRRIPMMHLLYVSGFGLLIFVVASRVIFGHSGELAGFAKNSWWARLMLFLFLLSAMTRATADFMPRIMTSHYQYAAWTWIAVVIIWVIWHRRRWNQRGNE